MIPIRDEVLGARAWSPPSSHPSALQLGDFGECLISKYLRQSNKIGRTLIILA